MSVHELHSAISRPRGVRERAPLVETVTALVIATLLLALFLGLSAIVPGEWTFGSTPASHLRAELQGCLADQDSAARLACYDEIAHRPPPHPARGANAPPAAFGAPR